MNEKNARGFKDINPELCTLCGTCFGICPSNALVIDGEKIRLEGECNYCGLCYDICPGREVNFPMVNKHSFGDRERDFEIGTYKSINISYSKDVEIRTHGASGGVVTSLLIFLLERDLIDGAIVVGMNKEAPWHYEFKIARTREEILRSSNSKYTLIPLNAVLKEIKYEEGNFAFVGLPCHIHGIRKLQIEGWKDVHKIKYLIGLFCGFNMHFTATTYLIDKLGIDKDDIMSLEYRGGEYPGGFVIKTKNGCEKFLEKFYYNLLNPMYVPKRCLLCVDLMNEFADISVGDIWTEGVEKHSTVIVRSEKGEKLFREIVNQGHLSTKEISRNELLRSHSHLIKHKKKNVFIRLSQSKVRPIYDLDSPDMGRQEYISGLIFSNMINYLNNDHIRNAVCILPLRLIGLIAYISKYALKGRQNNK